MMGIRKDHIRVRRQRQRKTNCDITPPSNRRVPRRMTSKGEGGLALWRPQGSRRPDRWPPGRCLFRDTWRIRGLRRPRRIRGLRRPRRSRELGRPWRVAPPQNSLGEAPHLRGALGKRRRGAGQDQRRPRGAGRDQRR